MFGIGGSEILVILVIALLFLGPDKLPDAAKQISKGIRDLKKQSRALQQQIENDEKIGGAIRDLKSALRGEDFPSRPPVRIQPVKETKELADDATGEAATADGTAEAREQAALEEPKHVIRLPDVAGEADPDVRDETPIEEIGALIKPAPGTIAKNADNETELAVAGDSTQKHG